MAMNNNGFGNNFYNRYMSNVFRNSNTVSEVASSEEPMMDIADANDTASNTASNTASDTASDTVSDAASNDMACANPDNPRNMPRTNPNTMPGNMPRTNPNTMPGNMPRTNPNTMPGNMPRTNPGTPGNMPRTNPNATPGNMPRSNPRATPNVTPGTTPNTIPATPSPAVSNTDFGPEPFVVDITKATVQNDTFRTALWTGEHLQVTLMSLEPGEDIGLEVHPNTDQFLRIESGHGVTMMGNTRDNLYLRQPIFDDFAIIVPAGTWHNIINTGTEPLKLYSIYAPPNHPHGTVHQTKAIAEQMGD